MKNTKRKISCLLIVALTAAMVLVAIQTAASAQSSNEPRKLAFIVGVSKYQKDGLTDLKYAHKDANDLSAELMKNGFEVTKLIGPEAKYEQVRTKLDQFLKTTSDLGKKDVVLISFSGHGVQKSIATGGKIVETPFFCVYDTLVTKPETMLSLNWVLERLKSDSGCGSNLMLIDACRNNPDKGARSLDGGTVRDLPPKVSMLFSSTAGQKSFESEKVKQGVFTHVLLKGLRGEAASKRGQVSWLGLANYVVAEVPLVAPALVESSGISQRPNLLGNITASTTIVSNVPSSKKIPLLPPGLKLTAAERSLRREKAIAELPNLGDADETAYIRGRVYGPDVLEFKMDDFDRDHLKYLKELASINKVKTAALYKKRAAELLEFLRLSPAPGYAPKREAVRLALADHNRFSILSTFQSESRWKVTPILIRTCVAITSVEDRQEAFGNLIANSKSDLPILKSLLGDLDSKWVMTHAPYAAVAPTLAGDVSKSIELAMQQTNKGYAKAALLLVCDTLLDNGDLGKAREVYAKSGKLQFVNTVIGNFPLPRNSFMQAGSSASSFTVLDAYVAGRLNDEKSFQKIVKAELVSGLYAEKELRLAFIRGLVCDL